jgi:tetratricopeptide (TPR) repeat protein
MRGKLLIILLLVFFPLLNGKLFSQNRKVDSVKMVISSMKEDSEKVKLLISFIVDEYDVEVWPPLNDLAKEIITKNLGGLKKGDKEYYFYKINLGDVFNNEGFYYQGMSNYGKALSYYEKALSVYLELNNEEGITTAWNNIGLCYEMLGDPKKALQFHSKALKLREKNNDQREVANSLVNIASIYRTLGEDEMAVQNFSKALGIYSKTNDHRGKGVVLQALADHYYAVDDTAKALEYYAKAGDELTQVNDMSKLARNYSGIAIVQAWMGRTDEALKNYNSALKLYQQSGEIAGEARILILMSKLMRRQGNGSSAIILKNAERAMDLVRKSGVVSSMEQAAGFLKTVYNDNGRYKEAFEMSRMHLQMRDSIQNNENKKATLRHQFQYEYERKAAADSVRVAEERKLALVQLESEKTQRYALYGGLALVAMIAFFVFRKLKESQSKQKIIEHQKREVEEKQKEILDSIYYARRIQRALITPEKFIDRKLSELKKKS